MSYLLQKFIKLRVLPICRIQFTRTYSSISEVSDIFDLIDSMPHDKESKLCGEESVLSNKVNRIYLEVLGSGAEGSSPSVVLKTNCSNYLINCGEGIQKLASEYKVKLSKKPQIFITFPSWKNLSGILGTALTLQDCNVPKLQIHGHSCIGSIFSGVNKFVNLRSLHVQVINCTHYEDFTDGFLLVKYVLLHPSASVNVNKNLSELKTVLHNANENSDSECNSEQSIATSGSHLSKRENEENVHKRNGKRRKRSSSSDVKTEKTPADKQKPAVSYIFTTQSTPGVLNLEKCLEYGVPPGPLLGDLKNGKDITLSNGNVVKSADVCGPEMPGAKLIVVECPSEDYLDSLVNEPIFYNYKSGDNAAEVVVHFSGSKIVKNVKYQNWIKSFPQETKHLFINDDSKLTGSVAIHRQQYKLNLLDSDLFPLLPDCGIPDFPRKDNCITDNGHIVVSGEKEQDVAIYSDRMCYKCESNNLIQGETKSMLFVKPKLNYDYTNCLVLKKDEFLKEVYQSDTKEKLEKFQEGLQELSSKLKLDPKVYPKILFLGTGSGKPSKVRNASGILISLAEDKCILFDCGENTYNQMVQFYGVEKTKKILTNLKAVFISHLHVDHHFGLATILKKRKEAFDELRENLSEESHRQTTAKENLKFKPVFLFAPLQLYRWLETFSEEFENISPYFQLIGNSAMKLASESLREIIDSCKEDLNLKSIETVQVCHCPHSFGIAIVHQHGWKITYSGDTRPCEDLVKLGMGSDVLIHEATFEDVFKVHAKWKLHSTTYEAIEVGKKMKAKYILLTHFSQRYCYLPNIEETFSNLNIGIAFDFMEVPFNKLPILPALLTPLQYIFAEHDEKIKSVAKAVQMRREKPNNWYSSYSKKSPADGEKITTEDEKPAKISKKALKVQRRS